MSTPTKIPSNWTLNRTNLNKLLAAVSPRVSGGSGVLTTQRDSHMIVAKRRGEQRLRPRFYAITGTPTSLGDNQWTYPFEEVIKTSTGYGGWTVKSGGRTDAGDWGEAFNFAEDANAATGIQGNGVDVANLTGTFEHQPIPENSIVEVVMIGFDDGSGYEMWIDRVISVDGDC